MGAVVWYFMKTSLHEEKYSGVTKLLLTEIRNIGLFMFEEFEIDKKNENNIVQGCVQIACILMSFNEI